MVHPGRTRRASIIEEIGGIAVQFASRKRRNNTIDETSEDHPLDGGCVVTRVGDTAARGGDAPIWFHTEPDPDNAEEIAEIFDEIAEGDDYRALDEIFKR